MSRQKQIVSPQKQIASRQKQTGYGKSKLEMAKATLLRQKEIRNGKSNFVTAKANWKCNSQLVKVESKFVAAKANCTLREVPNSWRTPKIVQDKSKTRSSPKQNWAKSVGESLLIENAESLRQNKISYFHCSLSRHKSKLVRRKSKSPSRRAKATTRTLGSLSIHSEGLGAK